MRSIRLPDSLNGQSGINIARADRLCRSCTGGRVQVAGFFGAGTVRDDVPVIVASAVSTAATSLGALLLPRRRQR